MDITQVAIVQTDLPTRKELRSDDYGGTVSSLVDLLMLVWGAGFFTTAVTTSCTVFEAEMDPEILRALVEEQDSVVKKTTTVGSEAKMTYEQLMEDMPLLD